MTWHQHGGSGLNWTRTEALDLTLQERDAALEWIEEQRSREAKALRQSARGRR